MKRIQPNLFLACAMAALQIAASFFPAFAQGFTLTPVVKRGDVFNGGRFFDCEDCGGVVPGPRAFNNRGDLLLVAETAGAFDDGLFLS